ncbi:MAG: alpha/beta hydrolase, partial [Pseudomonadota bacterium]
MKQKPAASDVTTMLIQANGMQFVADVGGPATGELVVMLHGFPQTRYTWRRELSHLAAHGYRVCAYDQRGYSPGARPEGIDPYAVEFLVNDVLAVVETLGYEKFHLVGHDWGGGVAWATALLNEVRVLSLSIISRPHPRAFGRALKEDPEQS